MPIESRIVIARATDYDLWRWQCRRCLTVCHHHTHAEAVSVGLAHLNAGCRPRLKVVA